MALEHKRWGFNKMMQKAKLDNKPWNHKRVHRIYCDLKLNIRIKPRKRLDAVEAKSLVQPLFKNDCWSIDFMTDVLVNGQKFRTLNVLDDYNRKALMIAPSYSLPSVRVTALIDQLAETTGYPRMIRVDNGPEFISHGFISWAKSKGIKLLHIQPGKPAQNGFIERFNRTYREAILDMNLFNSLAEVESITKEWLEIYNNKRPHESLAGLPPSEFERRRQKVA